MAGVPGVFWRCSAVLWGPSIHNPTWVAGKTHTSKNWPIFPICMWKRVGSAPSGQGRLWQPNGPECAKSHAASQSPSSRTENCELCQKIFVYFSTFFRAHRGDFCGFSAASHAFELAYFLTVLAAPGRLNPAWVLRKTHTSERSVLHGTYGHIHRYRGQIQ